MKKGIYILLISIVVLMLVQVLLLGYMVFQKNDNAGIVYSNINTPMVEPGPVPAIKSMPDLPKTQIEFEKITHDFGVITDDKKVYVKFKFKNIGKEPLIIIAAEGSCGCTVPTWPKEPIMPQSDSFIEISFDPSGKSGENSKIVTITSNAEPSTSILTVKATVVKSN